MVFDFKCVSTSLGKKAIKIYRDRTASKRVNVYV